MPPRSKPPRILRILHGILLVVGTMPEPIIVVGDLAATKHNVLTQQIMVATVPSASDYTVAIA